MVEIFYSILIFQDHELVYANRWGRERFGLQVGVHTWHEWLSGFQPDIQVRVVSLWQAVLSGDYPELLESIHWSRTEHVILRGDLLFSPVMHSGKPAVQVLLVESHQLDEKQSQRESEVMRDILAALASATGIQQALEVILVNLQGLILYDRAGLFLAELEAQQAPIDVESSLAWKTPIDNSILEELQRTRQPMVIADIQADSRFTDWPDMQSVRGWMGAPLLAGEQVIGFLSLGSLQSNAYHQADIEVMQVFATQMAEVLEKAWLYEQSHRRQQELEVISNFTSVLGQAESGAGTLDVIVDEISHFFGAKLGAFLLPNQEKDTLVVKVSSDKALVSGAHPRRAYPVSSNEQSERDMLWQVFDAGQTLVVGSMSAFLNRHPGMFYQQMLENMKAAVFIPLTKDNSTFGVLCLAYSTPRNFSFDDIHLYNTVAEIAGASLKRALALESLERQLNIRTQHLSTLYEINALAGEPLALDVVLQGILNIILSALHFPSGSIHLVNEAGSELKLVVHQALPVWLLPLIDGLSLKNSFWAEVFLSTEPLILPDLQHASWIPSDIRQAFGDQAAAYIGAPLRAEGKPLGLLSVYSDSLLDHTIEEITLFMTIADQIGGYVERARLIRQAERAAVMEERQRLARELHDSVTQLLYGQVLFAGASLKVLHQGDHRLAADHLARIDQAALQALKEMRLLVYELRPSSLMEMGLALALERRLESVERRTGVDAQLFIEGNLVLDKKTEMQLFRISEEALNNTLKHAQATTVTIVIHQRGHELTLYIEDDGVGYEMDVEYGGMGLHTMRERAEELGGVLQIDSAPGQGARYLLKIEVND